MKYLQLMLLVALGLITSVANADLIAHWDFNEGSGTTLGDSAGSYDGTISGDPEWVDGPSDNAGTALLFDGDGDFVVVGDTIDGLEDLTISMWISIDDLPDGCCNSLFHNDEWATGTLHFIITPDGNIRFAVNSNTPTDADSDGELPSDGTWHHIAVTYSMDGAVVNFYIDGVLDTTVEYTATGPVWIATMQIGGWNGDRLWNGKQDDIQIYDEVLDAAAIAELAANGGGSAGPNLSLIVEGATYAEEGGDITMTANEDMIAGGSLVWYKDGGIIPGETNATFSIVSSVVGDSGSYTLWFDDGEAKATAISNAVEVSIFPEGTLPVSGLIGLGLLAAVGSLGGVMALRKKSK